MEEKKLEIKQVYWKLQTIPQTQELEVGSREFKLYKEKYQEHNKLETDLDVLQDYKNSASKNPLWGKIYSLAVGFVDERTNEARVVVYKGDEVNIIKSFLNLSQEHFKGSKMIGYNLSFLLPFLRSRMLKNGIKLQGLHSGLVDLNCKAWTLQGICLADGFKGIGWWSNSLEELAFLLGLETNFVDGKDVYSYFLAEKTKELDDSIINEVFTLINCHKIINGEEVCTELNSTVTVIEAPVKEIELTLLQKLFDSKSFSAEIKKELVDMKIEDSEKENIKKLLLANYQSKGDKVGVKRAKELEINQFIDSL